MTNQMMYFQGLNDKIKYVINRLGLPTDFILDIRGYSKRYNGRYDINKRTIIIYALDDKGVFLPMKQLVHVVIHEVIHHFQWVHDPSFIRIKGVMHNPSFLSMEKTYKSKYDRWCEREKNKVVEAITREVNEISI